MNLNTLCNFANGTFVTLDDCLPDTGYEPNVMELTNAMELTGTTELNNATSSDVYFQDSLDYTAPSSDLYIDDDELGKLLAEVHRDCADYRLAEGVNVSQSSVSVMVDRTGELVERSDSDHFPCSVRNVKSAPNQFPVITQAKRMVDRTGEPVEERIAEERESSSAQIRTLFTGQCHYSRSLLVTLQLFRQVLPNLRIPEQAVQGQEVSPRQLTSAQGIQLAIMWRVVRHALGLPDVDFLLALLAVSQQLVHRQVCESPRKKLKMSTVIDQQDETEVSTPSRSQVDIYFQNHIDTAGAEPLQEAAPSPEQMALLWRRKLSTGTRNRLRTSLFSPRSDGECNV